MDIGSEQRGTRFLLYPQAPFLEAFEDPERPEVVEVSSPLGTVGPGPSNERMYTVAPIDKPTHYGALVRGPSGPGLYLPPWHGARHPPAMPDADGDFVHIQPGDPGFEQAHLFAAAHFTMDVWEGYFDRPIPWHFRRDYDRLELSILPTLDNALIGWGFLETGGDFAEGYRPYSLNFDVVAHEIGHAIIYSEVGLPRPGHERGEYYGFHESAADLAALIASLHFESVIDDVLANTRGNLYTLNRLSRFAELSRNRQIRLAANDNVLGEFARGWTSEHALSQPLTGAMFDMLVDVFHERLLKRGLITPRMEDLSDQLEGRPEYGAVMQELFDARYALDPEGFKAALIEARNYIGSYLADAWSMLDPDMLTYHGVEQALAEVDRRITGGAFLRIIHGNFRVRGIGIVEPGPRLAPPERSQSHSASPRTLVPD